MWGSPRQPFRNTRATLLLERHCFSSQQMLSIIQQVVQYKKKCLES